LEQDLVAFVNFSQNLGFGSCLNSSTLFIVFVDLVKKFQPMKGTTVFWLINYFVRCSARVPTQSWNVWKIFFC